MVFIRVFTITTSKLLISNDLQILINMDYPNLMIGKDFAFLFNQNDLGINWIALSELEYEAQESGAFRVSAYDPRSQTCEDVVVPQRSVYYAYRLYDKNNIDDIVFFLANSEDRTDSEIAHIIQYDGYELIPYAEHLQFGILASHLNLVWDKLVQYCKDNRVTELFLAWQGITGYCLMFEKRPVYNAQAAQWVVPETDDELYPVVHHMEVLTGRDSGPEALYCFSHNTAGEFKLTKVQQP